MSTSTENINTSAAKAQAGKYLTFKLDAEEYGLPRASG